MRYLARSSLIICAAGLFAGCGGSQTPISAPGAVAQSRTTVQHANRGGSWMLPEATSEDLIYAVNGCSGTCVLTYPNGKLVGKLYTGGGSAACSDAQGNVFISRNSSVTEWPHGATMPIATFTVPGYYAAGCAVDPTTGSLAVVFSGSSANVAVFPPGSQTPALYETQVDSYYCGYDKSGNLFVSGQTKRGGAIAELAQGQHSFALLTIDGTLGNPGQMQWDGSYMTYENRDPGVGGTYIARLSISGSVATIVGTTKFDSHMKFANQSWLYKKTVLVTFGKEQEHINRVGLWSYPLGGAAKGIFKFPNAVGFQGVTVSVAAGR